MPFHPSTCLDASSGDRGGPGQGPRSCLPFLEDLIAEEEHEVSARHRRAQRKRTADSASKIRQSRCLAVKENPFYEDAITKAARAQASKLDLSKASSNMVAALEASGILERPSPARIPSSRLRCLSHVFGIDLATAMPLGAPFVM